MRRAPGGGGWQVPHRIAIVGGIWGALCCVGSHAAVPIAAQRAGCPIDKVVEIEKSTNVALLDVCGTVERWVWDAIDGYQYAGTAADPRRPSGNGNVKTSHRRAGAPLPRPVPAPLAAASSANITSVDPEASSEPATMPLPSSGGAAAATPDIGQAGAASVAPAPGPTEL